MPTTTMLSEPPPFDDALQFVQLSVDLPIQQRLALLRAAAAALGRDRFGNQQRYVLKLDSWHTLVLPLLRAAFPETPWIFLFRDPIEARASQVAMRG